MKQFDLRTDPSAAEIIPEPGPISTQNVGLDSRKATISDSIPSSSKNESSDGS